MATARALLISHVNRPGTPADQMNIINRHLAQDTSGGRFMTLFYLIIQMPERKLQWVSAGHDPALLYDPSDDRVSRLSGGGIPLGLDGQWQYEQPEPTVAKPGQIIAIGTDGIWEAKNTHDEMFGKDALREVIQGHATESARDICTAVTDAVKTFRGKRPQLDDITLVVIKMEKK
jgi:sigma-B regulation protein RsbU (phosphoserine phosphatase)